jgi:hypothetical protein
MTNLEQPLRADYEDWFITEDTILLDRTEEAPVTSGTLMGKLMGVGAACAVLATATVMLF